jgi:hypothetical protein
MDLQPLTGDYYPTYATVQLGFRYELGGSAIETKVGLKLVHETGWQRVRSLTRRHGLRRLVALPYCCVRGSCVITRPPDPSGRVTASELDLALFRASGARTYLPAQPACRLLHTHDAAAQPTVTHAQARPHASTHTGGTEMASANRRESKDAQ